MDPVTAITYFVTDENVTSDLLVPYHAQGFGNHDPEQWRHQGEISWWDALHPGRAWAARLRQTCTASGAEERVRQFLRAPEDQKDQLTQIALDMDDADD